MNLLLPVIEEIDDSTSEALPDGWSNLNDSGKLDGLVLEIVATRNKVGISNRVLASVVPGQ